MNDSVIQKTMKYGNEKLDAAIWEGPLGYHLGSSPFGQRPFGREVIWEQARVSARALRCQVDWTENKKTKVNIDIFIS